MQNNENITKRRDLLASVIKQRTESLVKLKDEFSFHNREANRLQFTVEKLAIQNFEDQKKLEALEKEIFEIPTLSRNSILS